MRFSTISNPLVLVTILACHSASAQFYQPNFGRGQWQASADGAVFTTAIASLIAGAFLGLIVGGWRFLMSIASQRQISFLTGAIVVGGISLVILFGETTNDQEGITISILISSVACFFVGLVLALGLFATPPGSSPLAFGKSRFATNKDLEENGWLGQQSKGDGLFLGRSNRGADIVYRGDMHAMTIAPTRSGKGATAIIPNLLSLQSSVLVIDPKGENARATAARRRRMGHNVYVVDPWEISTQPDQYLPGIDPSFLATYNPLNSLDPDSPDLASDAMTLANALVIPSGSEPYWSDEAAGLIFGLLMHLVTSKDEPTRDLGRMRDILTLPFERRKGAKGARADEESLIEVLNFMSVSKDRLVRSSAARIASKEEKERSSVISTAQSNTHFLDSPVLRQNLAKSSIDFSILKTAERPVSVYLVLPLDRLPTFSRWLRLLVISALKDLMRIPKDPSKPQVRIILDEFAALKALEPVKDAYATMAGLGVQLWIITQDLNQLEQLYEDAWQTFVGNAGVFQYFGSRDYKSAEYASHLCGMTTITRKSSGSSTSTGADLGANSTGSSVSYDDVERKLVYPDELMTIPRNRQLIFIENSYPIVANKVSWFQDAGMQALQSGKVVKETQNPWVRPDQPAQPKSAAAVTEQAEDKGTTDWKEGLRAVLADISSDLKAFSLWIGKLLKEYWPRVRDWTIHWLALGLEKLATLIQRLRQRRD